MTSAGQPRPQGPVWRTRPIPATPSDTDGGSLSERDRARARRIAHPAARTRFVVGRVLLRDTVAELDPRLASAPLDLEVSPTGHLAVAGRPDLHVSVSHTRGLAAAAASAGDDVGIDVEPLNRGDLPPSDVWLTATEERRLRSLAPSARQRELLRLWVAKEAVMKALDGRREVTRRTIEVDAASGSAADAGSWSGEPAHLATLRWCAVGEGFVVAIASAATTPGE
jgi:4'-phosphopantetheinyl transferase